MSNDPSQSQGINTGAHWAVQIAQMFFQFLTLALMLYLGNKNQDKIEQVSNRQEEVADKASANAKKVKETLESKTESEMMATEIQLWSSWKYLDSIAIESGLAPDRTKAEEAKRLYTEFVKKRQSK